MHMRRAAALLLIIGTMSACRGASPWPPAAPTPNVELTVSAVTPGEGWPFYYTEIRGTGFKTGLRLTIGGLAAPVNRVEPGRLFTNPPWREPGRAEVVVTNPDGTSASLLGFTYKAATLELSKATAVPGETLTVTWSGPHDPSDFLPPDIIGVYALGDPTNKVLWSTGSGVGERFTQSFKAPTVPGAYEVRYHMLSQYLLAKVPLTIR
jgi:hypothetical protein